MPSLNRESIYAALLARLAAITSVKTTSRRVQSDPKAVDPADQPALFVPAGKEVPQYVPAQPMRWLLRPAIILYATTDDASVSPSTQLAPIVKDIEEALQWRAGETPVNPGGATTLGNTCVHCTISEVEYIEDPVGGQGVVFMPLEILAIAS